MDTIELQHILDTSRILSPLNGIVCPKDYLPKRKPANVKAYIINTHDSDQPGEHWVAIFFKNNSAIYFDSYGLPPLDEHILPFLQNNTREYTVNDIRLQDERSAMCGVYCIFMLDVLARGFNLEDIILLKFDLQHFSKNDKLMGEWFQQNYRQRYIEAKRLPKDGLCQCCTGEVTRGPNDPIPLRYFELYLHLYPRIYY